MGSSRLQDFGVRILLFTVLLRIPHTNFMLCIDTDACNPSLVDLVEDWVLCPSRYETLLFRGLFAKLLFNRVTCHSVHMDGRKVLDAWLDFRHGRLHVLSSPEPKNNGLRDLRRFAGSRNKGRWAPAVRQLLGCNFLVLRSALSASSADLLNIKSLTPRILPTIGQGVEGP